MGDTCPELQGGLSREAVTAGGQGPLPLAVVPTSPDPQRLMHERHAWGLGRKLEFEAQEGIKPRNGSGDRASRTSRALYREVLSKSLVGTGAGSDGLSSWAVL